MWIVNIGKNYFLFKILIIVVKSFDKMLPAKTKNCQNTAHSNIWQLFFIIKKNLFDYCK